MPPLPRRGDSGFASQSTHARREHRVLHQIPDVGTPTPHFILTGGDPLERADLFPLIDEARQIGIDISITLAATPKLTKNLLVKLRARGVDGLGLSLDSATAQRHDGICGVPGTY